MKYLAWLMPLAVTWFWSYVFFGCIKLDSLDQYWWAFPLLLTAVWTWFLSLTLTFKIVDP